jgi:hypothetical protein
MERRKSWDSPDSTAFHPGYLSGDYATSPKGAFAFHTRTKPPTMTSLPYCSEPH